MKRRCLISWAFGIIRNGEVVGVCTFGKPMWSVQVGVTGGSLWDVRKNKGRWRDVYELNRLWIDDDVTDHCIESKFIAWCLRQLKKENPNQILISYADASITNSLTGKNHVGVVYKAGGWIYTGLSSPWVDITVEGKDHRSVPKKMQGEKIGNRRTWAGVSTLKEAADSVQSQSGKIGAFLQEHLAGMLQLQLLNRTGIQGRKFARLAAEGAKFQIKQRATEMSFGAASVSVIVLGMGLILGYGGYEVTRDTLTVGGLVAFYGYVFRLFAPVSIAIDLQSRLQRVGASIRRILEITDGDRQIGGRESMTPLGCDIKPELEFRSVWFCYKEDRPVLRDMSFRIEASETVAVVGLNGSGKSTIGLLATRLYEPDAGSILVGGQDIRQVGRRSLRAALTLVPQDPILFDETIRENLLYGNPRATGKDLETVATLTQLDRVLQTLPKGLDEPLGPLGGRLSGGEKKRLALARTLLQQPRILIVDEITSALDGPAAAGLLRGLELFRQARTLVVISHRPATILWADRILVVDEGAVVDSGKHDELIRRCEAYRKIWQSQDKIPSMSSPRMEWTGDDGVAPGLSRNA